MSEHQGPSYQGQRNADMHAEPTQSIPATGSVDDDLMAEQLTRATEQRGESWSAARAEKMKGLRQSRVARPPRRRQARRLGSGQAGAAGRPGRRPVSV